MKVNDTDAVVIFNRVTCAYTVLCGLRSAFTDYLI